MAPSFLTSGFKAVKTHKSNTSKSSSVSSGRSRFSKALPAPPPVFDKLFSSSSASTPDKTANLPDLPSLPPPSSNLLDTASFSFVPSSNTAAYPSAGHGDAKPSTGLPTNATRHHLIPNIGSHASPTSPASSTTSVTSESLPLPPLPPQQPSRPIRRRPVASPASVTSPALSSQSLRSPASSAPLIASPTSQPLLSPLSPNVAFASAESTKAVEPAASTESAASAASAASTETAKPAVPPQLPDLPTHSTTPLGDLSASSTAASDLPLSPKQLQAPQPQASSSSSFPLSSSSPTLQELQIPIALSPPARQASPGAASISSILSAYTQSSAPVDRSSASEGTVSTNNSSLLTVSSPASAVKGGPDGQKDGDEVLTPLSYLLEEEYGVGDCQRRLTDDELYEHYRQYDQYEEDHASLDATSNVSNITSPPPPPRKDDDQEPQKGPQKEPQKEPQQLQALPPRTTSLSKPDPISKTVSPPGPKELPEVPEPAEAAAGRKTPEPLAALPSVSSSESPLWKRRSEKVDGGLVLPQLTLTSTPASAASAASTKPISTQQIGRKKLPAQPPHLSRPSLSPPRSPPTSPLPPPPPRSNLGGPHAQHSPLSTSSPTFAHLPSWVGLPSRDIRPSRQVTPALPSTPAAAEEAPAEASSKHVVSHSRSASNVVAKMGLSLTKLEAKVEHKLKRKDKDSKDVQDAKDVSSPSSSSSPLPPPSAKDLSSPSQKMPPLPPTPSHQRPPTPEYDEEECAKQQNGTAHGGVITAAVPSPAIGLVPASPATTTPSTTSPASMSGLGILSPSAPFTRMENGQVSPASSPRPTPPTSRSGLVGRDIRPAALEQKEQSKPFPERTSSRKESISTVTTAPIHYPDEEASVGEADSQVTIKAIPSLMREEGPMAAGMPPAFPGGYLAPVASDTVFAAPPPRASHYQCMHNHSDMFRDRNMNYPLSCQTCQTFDRSMRWRCKWCYLRICSGCRDVLQNEARGDLTRLMGILSQQPPVSENGHRQTDLPVIMEA